MADKIDRTGYHWRPWSIMVAASLGAAAVVSAMIAAMIVLFTTKGTDVYEQLAPILGRVNRPAELIARIGEAVGIQIRENPIAVVAVFVVYWSLLGGVLGVLVWMVKMVVAPKQV